MPHFIMNVLGHFFVVESEIDTNKLDGCTCFDSLDTLLAAAAKNTECTIEDLQGCEIRIFKVDGDWHETTHRGELIPIDDAQSIYDFLSNYEL
tara:strand:- start:5801 stop:6079 length:279 start_codon:yes stop_codon:yes gene_type:complete